MRKKYERRDLRPIRIEGRVAYVTLTKGYEAIIDAADVPLVRGWNWHASVAGKLVYAARSATIEGKRRMILMHRVIANAPSDRDVDHRRGIGLDNRKRNLRIATPSQNLGNSRGSSTSMLGVKGVHFHAGKYEAAIEKDGARYYLGRFETLGEASAAYQGAARVLFGEFARAA
jgi:hypothetical protein